MKLALPIMAIALLLLAGVAAEVEAVEESAVEVPEPAVTLQAENAESSLPFSLGIGYQAMVVDEYINGASVRCWFQRRIGAQLSAYHYKTETSYVYIPDIKSKNYFFAGKLLYAPVVNQNSKFYLGFEGGYGYEKVDYGSNYSYWAVSPLFGTEYHFSGLPEIGFNFEVGYRFRTFELKGSEIKDDMLDIWAGFGAIYYF